MHFCKPESCNRTGQTISQRDAVEISLGIPVSLLPFDFEHCFAKADRFLSWSKS
jgi:hypothetical protein